MEITLVTSLSGEEVHGTDNDKKTGCGINLQKVENITRFVRKGPMTDLKELTCEKCKTILAKRIIRADKKEMTRLIKEEKARAKKGFEDENIVPLGNTQAKITKPQSTAPRLTKPASAVKPAAPAVQPASAAPEIQQEPAVMPKTIPGTGVAIDSGLAAFAINVPKNETETVKTETSNVPNDLAQFAINKPQVENEFASQPAPAAPVAQSAPVQDDFLAQFAIPSPTSAPTPAPAPAPAPVSTPVQKDVQPANPVNMISNDDDIMKMFAVSSANTENSLEVLSNHTPAETSIYDNDSTVVDVNENEVSAVSETAPAPEKEYLGDVADWDAVANQLFESAAEPEPMPELTSVPEPQPIPEAAPAAESEPMPEIAPITEPEPMPEIAPVPEPEPMPEIAPVPEPEPMPEIAPVPTPQSVPEIAPVPAPQPAPEPQPIPEITPVPEPQPMPEITPVAEAVQEEINNQTSVQPNVPQQIPVQPIPVQQPAPNPIPAAPTAPPVQEQPVIRPMPQFAGYDMNGQPVYTYVQSQLAGYDVNGQPVYVPVQPAPAVQPQSAAPVQPQPAAPVQPQPATPVQPQPVAPVQPQSVAPGQFMAAAPVSQARAAGINISKVGSNRVMPKSVANAVASSKEKSQKNIFDMQGHQMPVLESIEDILTTMGDETIKKKKAEEKAIPVFEEYKGSSNTTVRRTAPAKKQPEPQRPMTKAELKAMKKQEKIDQKFKKDLAKRGF